VASTKYIFVTGGVISSLGKGIVSASIGKLLQARGYKVTIQKFDPYINVDGMLDPYEHGECFVASDGHAADLDLGHYERFLDIPTTCANNITSGRIYQNVINKERNGEYSGKTVQVVPHITDETKRHIKMMDSANDFDFVITEIGGTVGDIESLPFIESMRQLKWELGKDCLCVHLTYVPYIAAAKEYKSKPTQHSVKQLLEQGVQPDILVLRTEHELNEDLLHKVALFCNVSKDSVIQSIDVETIYEVPLVLQRQQMDSIILQKTGLEVGPTPEMKPWKDFLNRKKLVTKEVKIGLVGKYVELQDAYKSIDESLLVASVYNDRKLDLNLIQSETLNDSNVAEYLDGCDGILIAPGFGIRGNEGKIAAIKYAREQNVPCLAICLGMQCMVIEFARNVLGLKEADTTEFNPLTSHNVIDLMQKQKNATNEKEAMRLGTYNCLLDKKSKIYEAYGMEMIQERHSHGYEFNNEYKTKFEEAGMYCSGENPETQLVETVEIPALKWFVGVQYHPEYNSTVLKPNPLFLSFIKAAKSVKS
jgi:CTP synthase